MDPSDFDQFEDVVMDEIPYQVEESAEGGEKDQSEESVPKFSGINAPGMDMSEIAALESMGYVGKTESSSSSNLKQPAGSLSWDFRNGVLPHGVVVIGGDPEFILQQDGSTVLRLAPMSYLKVVPEALDTGGGKSKLLNQYSLTMDVYIEKFPDNPISLYQSLADPSRPTEGECLIYEGGGVGVFGEVGVADAFVKERRWTRIVVTLGTPSKNDSGPSAATAAALAKGQRKNAARGRAAVSTIAAPTSEPMDEDDDFRGAPGGTQRFGGMANLRRFVSGDGDETADEDDLAPSHTGGPSRRTIHMGTRGGPRANSTTSVPCLTTYVNSKKCSCVSAATRGVIGVTDGRFALNPKGFNLFASSQTKYMPGLLVRFVELHRTHLSDARVKEVAFNNRIYSAWDKEQAKNLAEMRAKMTLQPLYKAPPPIYVHPMFVAEVGDAFLEGTGMDGGSLGSCIGALTLTVDRLLRSATSNEGFEIPASEEMPHAKQLRSLTFDKLGFKHADMQAVNFLSEALKQSKNLFHKFGMAQKNGPAQLISFMKYFKSKLSGLSEGGVLIVPGGIEGASYVYLVCRQDSLRYKFCVFNADAEGGLMYHAASAAVPNKLKFQNLFAVNDVSAEKILDDAFWGFLFKLAAFPDPKFNTPAKLYAWLLPFLVDKPTDNMLSESVLDPNTSFRTPPRSNTGFLRCLLEASTYILRERQLTDSGCTIFLFLMRVQLIEFALRDTQFVPYLRGSDRSVLRIAASQLAYSAVKLGKDNANNLNQLNAISAKSNNEMEISNDDIKSSTNENDRVALLGNDALEEVQCMVEALLARCDSPRLFDTSVVINENPRELILTGNSKSNTPMGSLLYPFCDRLVRLEDVNGLAGAPVVQPKYVPVDFLMLPASILNLEDAVAAIRYTDHICTLLSVQTRTVKNTNLLKVSAIQNTFTRLLPVPKAPEASDYGSCIWRTPMRYGLQLDLLICLGRITEHFVSSVFSLPINRSLDGVRMVVLWAIAAIADAVLRLPKDSVLDQPSRFCLYLMGTIGGGIGKGFGISSAQFGSQAETIEVHHPELNITRTAILDYFDSQRRLEKIFNWNDGHMYEESLKEFLGTFCASLAFPTDEKSMVGYMVQGNTLINKNYPEFHIYRDITFYAKYVLNVDPRVFPPPAKFNQMSVELLWKFDQGLFMVFSFGGQFNIRGNAEAPFSDATHRYPSFASPSHLAQPHAIKTEDDVLHIRNLPTFEDAIGQQDSEILLSYLTIPYLRIPLVLSFFASEDRIHALRSKDLQAVVDSVVFEPGRYLKLSDGQETPKFVPTANKALLATSYGLLLNELQYSPEGVFRSVLILLKAAINLDVGTIHSTTVPIILYVLRFVARVESFVCFLIDHAQGIHETINAHLRGVLITSEILATLKEGKDSLRGIINSHVQRMIEAWLDELIIECKQQGDNSIVVDENTRTACQLHAHLLLLTRNLNLNEFTVDVASTLASSLTFLTTRHTWNHNILQDLPEHEVYEVLSVQRRRLIEWTRAQSQPVLDKIMESVLRVTTDTGARQMVVSAVKSASPSRNVKRKAASGMVWSFIAGPRSRGRFTQMSSRLLSHQVTASNDDSTLNQVIAIRRVSSEPYQRPPEISDDVELGVEIDLQTVQLTLKSAHLQALDSVIAADLDVQGIFGKASMQVTTVEATEHRLWVSLTGRNYDIQYWRTPDERPCIQEFDRDYNPGELFETEQWIAPIFEPVRLTYMVKPFVLQICMPEMPYGDDVDVASMVGIHPKNGGVWKEILVYKKLGIVQVFNVVSHGRRFYRVLEYTSDVRYTLREMQPSTDDRRSPWPVWERHGCGHPYDDHWGNPLSCVITRTREHPKNLSGGIETLIPVRLLYGTIPQALLDTYQFWQDEEDFIRGYPIDDEDPQDKGTSSEDEEGAMTTNKCPHMLLVRLLSVNPTECCKERGVGAHIRRVLKAPMIERKNEMLRFLNCIDESGTVMPSDTWKLDFSVFKTIGKIVDSGVDFSELLEFLAAIKLSGVKCTEIRDILSQFEEFVEEQRNYDETTDALLAMGGGGIAQRVRESTGSRSWLASVDAVEDMTLISIHYADPESRLGNLFLTLSRLENVSNILCWTATKHVVPTMGAKYGSVAARTTEGGVVYPPYNSSFFGISDLDSINLDLVELPRLKISFHEKVDENGLKRLYSIDHSNLFVSNYRSPLMTTLMRGIPHSLLLSTVDEELHILVPITDPVRPRIGSNPFSCELVLDRNNNPEWYAVQDTAYFVYPVHVSLSFLFTPTLSSALYLLLLRFLHRSYEEVMRLANTIGTDTEYSPEENMIFLVLGRSNGDGHPNAHACRLKISYVLLDSPVSCPWNITRQMSRYISKLGYVSTSCRLLLSEELALLETCVTSSADPRFYDVETGKPLYSDYEVCIVRNRLSLLKAMMSGRATAKAETVPRIRGSNWPHEKNMNALMLPEGEYMNLQVTYAAPGLSSGHAALQVAHKFWNGSENSSGDYARMGFLYLYELLTGTKKVKILDSDCSKSFAVLLAELLSDKAEAAFMPSILSAICRHPYLATMMPKFKDNRKFKNAEMAASDPGEDSSGGEVMGPLGSVLAGSLAVLQSEIYNIMTIFSNPTSMFPSPSDDPVHCFVTPLENMEANRIWIVPKISNYSCSKGTLDVIESSSGVTGELQTPDALTLSAVDLDAFTTQPLKVIDLQSYLVTVSHSELGRPLVSATLPFDVSSHPMANSAIARSMISRLESDVADYANAMNTETKQRLRFLQHLLEALSEKNGTHSENWNKAVVMLEQLISKLEALRETDSKYIENALPWLMDQVNAVTINASPLSASDDEFTKRMFILRRLSGQETYVWLEFLFGTILSSSQFKDLQQLNPFLSASAVTVLNSIISATVLHANRIGQINRCLLEARSIQKTMKKILHIQRRSHLDERYSTAAESDVASGDSVVVTSLMHDISLKSDSLVANLLMARHYVESFGGEPSKVASSSGVEQDGVEYKRQKIGHDQYVYDPRFLLFEFTWNILLRKVQVEMVRDYISDLRKGASSVKQMIMGAGKTTVVCPLLTLILSDGESLVVQVVPPALLEFSRSIMRSTFSSIMHKRIFTLQFDRSTEVSANIFTKLLQSRSTRGVVITTPTTVKSMMLKFLETMEILRNPNEKLRHQTIHKDCQELGRVLNLFQESILIMDEVDLILHPMKSELNFPIGPKQELDLSPQRWLLPIHLLDAIYFCDLQRMSVPFKSSKRAGSILRRLSEAMQAGYSERALQRNPHCILLNTDWYQRVMKPIMADWAHLWLEANHVAGISKADCCEFLINGAYSRWNGELAGRIEASNLTSNHRKLLNLARDWLDSFLPHCLQKIDRVSFGIMNKGDYERAIKMDPFMPRTRSKLAIPFVGKDVPSRSSEFAHPDIIIGLTILGYRYEGLRWSDFEDMVANLRSSLIKEEGPWKARKSAVRYARWVRTAGGCIRGDGKGGFHQHQTDLGPMPDSLPLLTSEMTGSGGMDVVDSIMPVLPAVDPNVEKIEVVSLRLLKRSNEQQMKKLFDLICKLPEAIHYYLENFIFPNYMDSKITKLSAAGQDLGGDMMFSRRIGFSGTPSDLLPIELGKCGYEKKSDGQMISVMTSPTVCGYEVIAEHWSPHYILDMISHSEANGGKRFNALIDTGALITGLTNLQVAQRLLSGDGLPWCEGVVFLDENDRKMILVRATGRVLKLAQSGIVAEKRFAFYDQVHTTGMDIQHTINACAVLTLSKDMVFRDYVQGAYRMRGINKGQSIHVYIIPEVKDLMLRELGSKASLRADSDVASHEDTLITKLLNWHSKEARDVKIVLTAVNAWLIINSMRSERVQFNQLCIQNVANVWRKSAYASLLMRHHELTTISNYSDADAVLRRHLETFCEPIDFSLEEGMSDPVHFSEAIKRRAEQFSDLIVSSQQKSIIDEVLSWVSLSAPSSGMVIGHEEREVFLDSEMVQEQEQEQEEEQEREQEQEIEIEKYVDLAYSREHEEPVPWPVSVLTTPLNQKAEPFYPLSAFKLYKRSPLPFPEYVYCSNNYFNPMWSGARRIKNVAMVLDWIPDPEQVALQSSSYEPLSETENLALDKAISLYDMSNVRLVTETQLNQILISAVNVSFSQSELRHLLDTYGVPSPTEARLANGGDKVLPVEALRKLLISGYFSRTHSGRRYVALSLAEAETLRRVLHLRKHAATYKYIDRGSQELLSETHMLPLIEGFNSTMALRCLLDGFRVIDSAHGYFDSTTTSISASPPAPMFEMSSSSAFMQDAAEQILRFFNSDMFFSPRQLNILLRSLHGTTCRSRKMFFKHVLSCRRRAAKKWLESSVAKLFIMADQFSMLKHRAMAFRFAGAIRQTGLSLYDAFNKFDFDKNGLLSPGEVWGAFEYLTINLSANDVLDFVSSADVDRDGNLSMKELASALEDPEKAERERKRLEQSENEVFYNRAAMNVMEGVDLKVSGDVGDVESAMDIVGDNTVVSGSSRVDTSLSIPQASGEPREDDDDDDIGLLPEAPRLQRSTSGGGTVSTDDVVLPKGESELRELQQFLTRQEEELEAMENAAEVEQEMNIQKEIEDEEDESDRLQEGGRNPAISGDLVRFDFSTGRLPRRVSTRGDVIYKNDEVLGTYLSVCPMTLAFLSVPAALTAPNSSGLCGGRRLNRYTAVLEVMFEALPTGGALYPIFSPAAYAETEAMVWINSSGQLTDAGGRAFSKRDSGPKLTSGKWHVISIVVDCLDRGSLVVFIDGTQCTLGTGSEPSSSDIVATTSMDQVSEVFETSALDGPMSIAQQLSIFGSKGKAFHNKSVALRCFSLYTRVLHQSEIAGLTDMLKSEAKEQAVELITQHLQAMGVDITIAQWAANAAEGETIEQRINSALNMVYQ